MQRFLSSGLESGKNRYFGSCWMKNVTNYRRYISRLVCLLIVFLVPRMVLGASQATEQTFALLQTKTAVYTNVTVTKKTDDWVFIMHSTGVCNVKVSDLPLDARTTLGYGAVTEEAASSGNSSGQPLAQLTHLKFSEVGHFASDWRHNGKLRISALTGGNPMVLYVILGILGVVHIFISTCFWLICRKTHIAPGPLVWVPVLQLIPLLRAANMSVVWFFAYFIPVLNIIAAIVWSVKIVKTRGKSPWVAFLLIVPVTNFFAFLYLAFSRSAPVQMKSTEILALETA
jgi:hypothetical protein